MSPDVEKFAFGMMFGVLLTMAGTSIAFRNSIFLTLILLALAFWVVMAYSLRNR